MNLAHDPVRRHTADEVLRRIDDTTVSSLQSCADAPAHDLQQRLVQLDREWDTDRVLETEAAVTGLLGLALGVLLRPQFLLLPAIVAASVLVHARTGRYPLMPALRRLGVRTSREIARERYALKALRGDFNGMSLPGGVQATPHASAPAAAEPQENAPAGMH